MRVRWPSSVELMAFGVVCLSIGLMVNQLDYYPINWVAYWFGSVMVVVGTGKLFFLD
jgi:hypothetical protein